MTECYFLDSGPIGLPLITQKSAGVYNCNSTTNISVPLGEQLSLSPKRRSPTCISVSQQQSYKEGGLVDSLVETSDVSRPVRAVISRRTESPTVVAWSKLKKVGEENMQGGQDENQFVEKQVYKWTEVTKKRKTEQVFRH